jgi:hypothetical protein
MAEIWLLDPVVRVVCIAIIVVYLLHILKRVFLGGDS